MEPEAESGMGAMTCPGFQPAAFIGATAANSPTQGSAGSWCQPASEPSDSLNCWNEDGWIG